MSLYVRPAPGRVILDPTSDFTPVPEAGKDVPRTAYWLRAIDRGDLLEGPVETPPATPARAARKPLAEGDA